jgi:hypothetical protein
MTSAAGCGSYSYAKHRAYALTTQTAVDEICGWRGPLKVPPKDFAVRDDAEEHAHFDLLSNGASILLRWSPCRLFEGEPRRLYELCANCIDLDRASEPVHLRKRGRSVHRH